MIEFLILMVLAKENSVMYTIWLITVWSICVSVWHGSDGFLVCHTQEDILYRISEKFIIARSNVSAL